MLKKCFEASPSWWFSIYLYCIWSVLVWFGLVTFFCAFFFPSVLAFYTIYVYFLFSLCTPEIQHLNTLPSEKTCILYLIYIRCVLCIVFCRPILVSLHSDWFDFIEGKNKPILILNVTHTYFLLFIINTQNGSNRSIRIRMTKRTQRSIYDLLVSSKY